MIFYRNKKKPLIIAIKTIGNKLQSSYNNNNKNNINNKNNNKNNENKNEKSNYCLPNNGQEYLYTKNMLNHMININLETDFLFIYFDTNDQYSNCFCLDGVLCLTENELKVFFGPFFHMYKTCKNNIQNNFN